MTVCHQILQQSQVLDAVEDDGTRPQRHTARLFTQYAPVQPEMPSLALYVNDVESSLTPGGPSLGLQQFDHPPRSLDPIEARQLTSWKLWDDAG